MAGDYDIGDRVEITARKLGGIDPATGRVVVYPVNIYGEVVGANDYAVTIRYDDGRIRTEPKSSLRPSSALMALYNYFQGGREPRGTDHGEISE